MSLEGRPSARRTRRLQGPHAIYDQILADTDEHGLPDPKLLGAAGAGRAELIQRAQQDILQRAAAADLFGDGGVLGDPEPIGNGLALVPRLRVLKHNGEVQLYDGDGRRIEPSKDMPRA